MSYTDKIKCPHCKEQVDIEVEIEGRSLDDLYAIINTLERRGENEYKTDAVRTEAGAVQR